MQETGDRRRETGDGRQETDECFLRSSGVAGVQEFRQMQKTGDRRLNAGARRQYTECREADVQACHFRDTSLCDCHCCIFS